MDGKVIIVVLRRVNPVSPICNSLVGEHHSFVHRAITGIAIMMFGVWLAKHYGHSHNEYIAMCADCVGFGLHGVGLIPFVEGLVAIGAAGEH